MPAAPPAPPPALLQARTAYSAGDLGRAAQLCREALAEQPECFDAVNLLGIIAARTGHPAEAERLFAMGTLIQPGNPFAQNNRGNALNDLGHYEEALRCFDRALALSPGYAEAHANRGNALKDMGRYEEALLAYARALQLQPDNPLTFGNRGLALHELGRPAQALECFERALAIRPGYADAHVYRALALQDLQRLDAAREAFGLALALAPGHPVAHWNLARFQLLTGDYEQGWAGFEWRWKVGAAARQAPRFPTPPWLGETPLEGRTLLLHAEQGYGDTLQFCRYATLAARAGAKVLLSVPAPLVDLLGTLEGAAQVLPESEPMPGFDADADLHCPLMSLPLAFRTMPHTIPASPAYLRADPARRTRWQARLGTKRRPRIGLAWSGGLRPDQPELQGVNLRRNLPLWQLAPLGAINAEFHSLQLGEPAQSEPALLAGSGWQGPIIAEHGDMLTSFAETAALVSELDLVITVDTSCAHLAGALGVPVWILNRHDSCWRWFLEREDSPWYPSVRIYRQARPGDWEGVIERVTRDLALFVEQRRG